MAWTVILKRSASDDLGWFGKKEARRILQRAREQLQADPLAETRNLTTLRPNPIGQRELRLEGRYRVLFDVDVEQELVTIVLVGEKRGSALFVQGEEFTAHHESNPPE
jgi:mRNA-degrading endonuclease RelE of RelBE toxin-antitoxin system